MLRRIADWLDERTGYRWILEETLQSTVRGGSRWGHSFGAAMLVLLGVEALSGIGLAAYYAPTTTDAWASVQYLQNQVALGWLLRGVHHYGASALVILLGLHLLQTLWYAAYRSPRELNWVAGVFLLLLLLAASHTGFLLPGDLRAYWATQVLLGIAESQLFIGEHARTFLQGGPDYGNLTLTRLYALHAFVLPGLLAGGVLLHLALRRRAGATAPPALSAAEAIEQSERYFPAQLARDLALSLLVVGAVVAVAWRSHGAELHAPADPSIEFLARPEWYFLPIFHLRHLFPGEREVIATTLIPGAAVLFLAAIPFLDALIRRSVRWSRGLFFGSVVCGLLLAIALGAEVEYQDRTNPRSLELMARADALSREAQRLATAGVPVTGPLELYRNDPVVWGQRVFQAKCATCHHPCTNQPFEGDVCLQGYATRTWLTQLIRDPANRYFFGNSKIDEMDPYDGSDEDLRAIVEFVYSQGGRPDVDLALAERGRALYERDGCESCHSLDGEGTGQAPDLKGYASEAWLSAFVRDPGGARFYGELNQMDAFPHEKLGSDELEAVVSYLRAQTDAQAIDVATTRP